MKTQREYNGVCKVPSQVLPSAADLKRLQKKRKKMEDQLKAKGDSEDRAAQRLTTQLIGESHQLNNSWRLTTTHRTSAEVPSEDVMTSPKVEYQPR
ncbi:hypothetical protein B9Z55_018624 [Caenorhabditis nigoni]|uniref:Uncharacterized protein n=1 Tax=Caenorhabditis nigoni TaxID=1611254 RepID=A0A2G5TEX6_9PELO|nr:hypothetical protein B9Z55_018624 [Caenorhabditis nigoni]